MLNLLYIDDEKLNLFAIKALLRDSFNIFTTEKIDEVFEIIKNNHINIVMTDHKMTDMTGVELLEIIRDKYPDIIRVILSGYIDNTDIINAVESNLVNFYITKPFDEKKFYADITDFHCKMKN